MTLRPVIKTELSKVCTECSGKGDSKKRSVGMQRRYKVVCKTCHGVGKLPTEEVRFQEASDAEWLEILQEEINNLRDQLIG
jgi:hypothetical protein